jgi:hypothetical protein
LCTHTQKITASFIKHSWGDNAKGQLGDGSAWRATPTLVRFFVFETPPPPKKVKQ